MPDKRKPSASMSGPSPYAKRARSSYAEADEDDEEPSGATPHERPRNHPIYGQKGAFPGLDDSVDELFYGPAEDGLEYLRMVRSEANSLPSLFVAAKASQTPIESVSQANENEPAKDQQEQPSPLYADGVFIAPPVTNADASVLPGTTDAEESYTDAQAAYYNLLRHRFLLLRSTLKCAPPLDAIAALDDSHPISLPRSSKVARKEWRRLLLAVDPQMVQLACMDMDSVLGVLGILARLMSETVKGGDTVQIRRIGAWAWGLLGKCREVGQLGTEEVGEIRDLGKRAVTILRKMKEQERNRMAPLDQELSDGDSDEGHLAADEEAEGEINAIDLDGEFPAEADDQEMPDVPEERQPEMVVNGSPDTQAAGPDPSPDELEAAKTRLQAKLRTSEEQAQSMGARPVDNVQEDASGEDKGAVDVGKQTRAMLEMVITVVGEYYGQKDLLEAREVWDGCSE